MAQERTGVVTMRGNPVTLIGPEIRVGNKAPNFTVIDKSLSPVTLESGKGKVRLISVVPSLDTPVCDAQTKRFNEEAAKLPADVEVWTVSMDLPFAQNRYCGANNVNQIKVLSDHREASFGQAYGTLMKDLRLLARAIFVIDKKDIVHHVEYVKEIASHPNYDAALEAAKKATTT